MPVDFHANPEPINTETSALVPHHADNQYFPWYFMHHPATCWECVPLLDKAGQPVRTNGDLEYEILPSLRHFKLKPGIQGIRMGAQGANVADWTASRARREAEGWVFVEHAAVKVTAFGKKGGSYAITYDGQRGKIYAEAWEKPTLVQRPGKAIVVWTRDPLGFAVFRRDLIKRGILQPPSKLAIDDMIRRQEQRAGRRLDMVHVPHIARMVQEEGHKLDVLRGMSRDASTAAPTVLPASGNPMATAKAAATKGTPLADADEE